MHAINACTVWHGFQAANPQIEIRIDACDRQVDLQVEAVDVAIRRVLPQQVAGYANLMPLWEEFVTPALSQQLLERRGLALTTPADLSQLPLIEVDDERASAQASSWASWFEFVGAAPHKPSAGRLMFGFTDQAVQAAVRGQGVVLGMLPLIEETVANGQLTTPFMARRMATGYRYFLLVNQQQAGRPEVVAFVDWLIEAFAQGPLRSS